ncbi:hypothetical protein SLEP1_g52458 [Rubroshorea leprosula]|uniref:DUF659 domain-containing protein n=1 Tax=Rubroshorea leprosula TaxID=152421 RepID=A0AAV5M6B1_9ROSI|nr:hypothetical protein SLEP1_g52458 [Rubroshorea leprosula]
MKNKTTALYLTISFSALRNMEEASEDSNAASERRTSLKRKSNDIGWECGELCDPNKLNAVECKLCGHVCRGGVYRIKQHIAHYKTSVKKWPLSLAEDKRRCLEALLGGNKGANRLSEAKRAKEEAGLRDEFSCSILPGKSLDFDVDDVQTSGASRVGKHGPMDRYLGFLSKPLKHPSFLALCEALGRYGRGYRPPSRYQLSEPLLKEEVGRTKESLKKHEQEWKYTGCSVIIDCWTDSKQRSIMNLCVNSGMGTIFLSREDSEQALTAEYIADYGIRKFPQFDGIISKAKNLTIFIHAHRRTLNMMHRITLRRDIVKLGVTKFATTFLTLQSLFEKKGKLMFMFSSDDWSMCKLSSSYKGKEASATVLSIKFWEGVNRCLKVFGPLVLRLGLGDKPSMGFIVGELENARKEIKAFYKNKQEKYKPILDVIEENSKDRLDTPLHKAAYLMNPHYYYNDPTMRMDSGLQKAALTCIEKFLWMTQRQ